MRYNYNRSGSSIGKKGTIGAVVGGTVGFLGGCVVAGYGGYEIGSAINDYLHINGDIGRGLLDMIVVGLIASPALYAGAIVGAGAGGVVGAVCHPFIEGCRSIFRKNPVSEEELRYLEDSVRNEQRKSLIEGRRDRIDDRVDLRND